MSPWEGGEIPTAHAVPGAVTRSGAGAWQALHPVPCCTCAPHAPLGRPRHAQGATGRVEARVKETGQPPDPRRSPPALLCSALLPDRLPCFPGAINCWPGPARPPRPPHGGVSAMSYEERAARPGLRSRAPTRSRPRSSLLLHAPEPLSSRSHPAHAAALEGFTPWDPCASWFSKEGWLERGVYPGRAGRWLADSFRNTL